MSEFLDDLVELKNLLLVRSNKFVRTIGCALNEFDPSKGPTKTYRGVSGDDIDRLRQLDAAIGLSCKNMLIDIPPVEPSGTVGARFTTYLRIEYVREVGSGGVCDGWIGWRIASDELEERLQAIQCAFEFVESGLTSESPTNSTELRPELLPTKKSKKQKRPMTDAARDCAKRYVAKVDKARKKNTSKPSLTSHVAEYIADLEEKRKVAPEYSSLYATLTKKENRRGWDPNHPEYEH